MTERRAAGLWIAVAAALTSLALSGCGAIPSSGPVHAGVELDGPPPVRVLARPPDPGASPLDIVRGFLGAQPGLDDDAAVARLFLVGQAARTWGQNPQVVVYPDESSLTFQQGAGGLITVTTPMVATVDVNGVYTTAAAGTKAVLKARLVQSAGQWRITSLDSPDSRWLTSFDLDRAYRQAAVYYAAPHSKVLVPDLRWFPGTPGLATVIARAQLAPPPDYLRPAVQTGIPAGTDLAVDSVPSTGLLATVELSSAALRAPPGGRALMWAQLTAAVAQAPGVDRVRIFVGGKLLELPGASLVAGTTSGALGWTTEPGVTADPVVWSVAKGHSVLTQLVGNGQETGPAPHPAALPTLDVALRSLARSVDAREFAGVTTTGTSLVRFVGGKSTGVVLRGTNLTQPSYDPQGWLWVSGEGPGGTSRLRAVQTGADVGLKTPTVLTPGAPWLAGRSVVAVRLSRDGARAVVVSVGKGSWRIDVAGVVRDGEGHPLSLSPPLRIGLGINDIRDVTWVSSTSVAVLGQLPGEVSTQPYLVTIGGETSALPTLAGGVAIFCGAGAAQIDVVTTGGRVYGRSGIAWTPIARSVGVAFPG